MFAPSKYPSLDQERAAVRRLSISQRIIAEKTVCVLLVRGENPEGQPIFAYVAVRADKLTEFMEAQKTGLFYPEEFGVIVESGEGEPSPEVRRKMETEYGFDHEAMIDIPDQDKALDVSSDLSRKAGETFFRSSE